MKLFFSCSTQLSVKLIVLRNVKMPAIVGKYKIRVFYAGKNDYISIFYFL